MFDSVRISMKNNMILVEWTNLTERELLEYVVERSLDARTFTAVARVSPRSNLNEPMSYDEVDTEPLNGLSYYRIRVNAQTGKIIYSIVLKIRTGSPDTDFSIYPNPCTNGQLGWTVSNLPSGNYQLSVTGMHGQCVLRQDLRLQGKASTGAIALPGGSSAGVYQLRLVGDGVDLGKRFVVQ